MPEVKVSAGKGVVAGTVIALGAVGVGAWWLFKEFLGPPADIEYIITDTVTGPFVLTWREDVAEFIITDTVTGPFVVTWREDVAEFIITDIVEGPFVLELSPAPIFIITDTVTGPFIIGIPTTVNFGLALKDIPNYMQPISHWSMTWNTVEYGKWTSIDWGIPVYNVPATGYFFLKLLNSLTPQIFEITTKQYILTGGLYEYSVEYNRLDGPFQP